MDTFHHIKLKRARKEDITITMTKRRAIDLVQVFTEDDLDYELYGDGPRPPRDPNAIPKIFFGCERPLMKAPYNNTPFGRAVARTYTSDTSTEFETTDEDDNESDAMLIEDHRLETSLSDDGGVTQNAGQSSMYCKCPATPKPSIADGNEPESSISEATNKINDLSLTDRRCRNCMLYKRENSELAPRIRRKVVVKRPKNKKRRKCQIVRKLTGYILESSDPSHFRDYFNS